ncbi:MerR family transcriptional regulator [Pseudoalteromonas piscicida]|uniref:MerR family transcriptional regulator n=1 Tax=Pseudoalteromonas piscicida TaxID=43662 RepID=A0AAD0RK45_PSEO7|nr:MerR family transcriptional regulator [Pseudoalteromonas piscicida]ASD69365.1 transcriptional regulator [Pseudoalteromonas piscicida]AXR04275.1 MerR family transcriptional regulator [Pseudoalteromonas piscicida]
MYIGKLSKQTGLSVKAIRFYEEKGLIPTPERVGRYRVYSQVDVDLLLLIKEAKLLGVSIKQLQQVIEIKGRQVNWVEINTFLVELKASFMEQVVLLQQKIHRIEHCIASLDECPQIKLS